MANKIEKAKSNKKSRKESKQSNENFKYHIIFSIILIAACVLVYGKTLGYDLIYFDDFGLLNLFKGATLNMQNIGELFNKTLINVYYRPLLSLSIIMDQPDAVQNFAVFHRTNLLFHIISTILVYFTLFKLLGNKYSSLFGSLLFAVHPLLVPATAWIFGRNDPLLAIFALSSFLSYLYYDSSKNSSVKYASLVLHLVTFQLAMWTKESAVTIPIIIIIYAFLVKKRGLKSKDNLTLYLFWIIIGVIWYFMRQAAVETSLRDLTVFDEKGIGALIKNFPAYFAITGKIFLPVKLVLNANFESFSIISGIVFTVILIAMPFILKDIDKRMYLFGALWFLAFLMPTLMIKSPNMSFDYVEHRAYIPLVGILLMLFEIFKALNIDFEIKKVRTYAVIVLILFAGRAFVYANTFKDLDNFWNHYISMNEDKPVTYKYVGQEVYLTLGKFDKSREVLDKGVARFPQNADLLCSMALLYQQLGDRTNASNAAIKALNVQPGFARALNILGNNQLAMGDTLKAIDNLTKAAQNDTTVKDYYFDLGNVYFATHNYPKAIECYNNAITIFKDYDLAYNNAGAAWQNLGRADSAIADYNKAIKINPKMYNSYNNLIRIYAASNRPKAIELANLLIENGGTFEPGVRELLGN